jgi:hypothetical protein
MRWRCRSTTTRIGLCFASSRRAPRQNDEDFTQSVETLDALLLRGGRFAVLLDAAALGEAAPDPG